MLTIGSSIDVEWDIGPVIITRATVLDFRVDYNHEMIFIVSLDCDPFAHNEIYAREVIGPSTKGGN